MNDAEIINAFHLMWDDFPEPAMITQKSREIVAVNKRGIEIGLRPGLKCSSAIKPQNIEFQKAQWGPFTGDIEYDYASTQEQHGKCMCDQAIALKKPIFVSYQGIKNIAFSYWIPISEKPEWILHFGVGNSFDYEFIKR